jgi:uncharacterized protein
MFRNLILIVAVVALVWIARGFIRRAQLSQKKSMKESRDMVQCEQCQTFLPKDDAVQQDDHFFCGRPHLEEWKRQH